VRRGLEDPPVARTRYQGREAVLLGTTMAPGANVTEVGAEVQRTLKRIEQDLPLGIELGRISDQAQVVTKSIHEFLEAFGEAVSIVLMVSLIALGWLAGIVVALTIPLVLAATIFVLSLMGIDLHRISLGALVIALGLLVDDAMIAVEMMDRKLKEGHDRLAAATFAYTSTAFPSGGLRAELGRGICEHTVLGHGHCPDHVMVRSGLFHALDRLQAAQAAR